MANGLFIQTWKNRVAFPAAIRNAGENTYRKDHRGLLAADHAQNHSAMITLLEAGIISTLWGWQNDEQVVTMGVFNNIKIWLETVQKLLFSNLIVGLATSRVYNILIIY